MAVEQHELSSMSWKSVSFNIGDAIEVVDGGIVIRMGNMNGT
jgi:hypothetical protein